MRQVTTAEAYDSLAAARAALQTSESKGGKAARAAIAKHLDAVTSKKSKASSAAAKRVAVEATKTLAKTLAALDRNEVMGATLNESIKAVENLAKGEDPRVVQLQTEEAAAQLSARREREKKVLREAWNLTNPVTGAIQTLQKGAAKAADAAAAGLKWGTGILVLVGGVFLVLMLRKGR